MTRVRFCFDFISPYAYIASKSVQALAARHGRQVELVPVLFAALLDANGQKGPAEIPSKRLHTFKDAFRKAHRAGLTLVMPPSHPFNPLTALRVVGVVDDSAERARLEFADAFLRGEDPAPRDLHAFDRPASAARRMPT